MTSWARVRRWAAVGTVAAVLAVGATGCGGDDEADAATAPQDVAHGVVLDGPDGSPVADVEVELLVWPAALSSTVKPSGSGGASDTDGPQPTRVDVDVTDSAGEFDLEAVAADLSPHANADGQVGIELRVVGVEGAWTRTSVRLERAETGVVSVVRTEDVVVVVPEDVSTS